MKYQEYCVFNPGAYAGKRDTPRVLRLDQRVALGRDLALRLDIARNHELGRGYNNGAGSILYYF